MGTIQTEKNSYTTSTVIEADAQSVFEALTSCIDSWWGKVDHPIEKAGDVFTVSWGEPWYQFRVIEYLPNERVSWECIDANQIIAGMQGVEKEWVGTKVTWNIEPMDETEIELTLLHEGLVPEFLCFDVCSRTWDSYIKTHLKRFLEHA